MSLHIRAVAPPAAGRLRQLLLESLPQILGGAAQALPSAGFTGSTMARIT